jgi:hypothetical protein
MIYIYIDCRGKEIEGNAIEKDGEFIVGGEHLM